MKPSEALKIHRDKIISIVEHNNATNPRVFGSVARGEDTEGSDLDLLVQNQPEMSLFDQCRIIHELENLLGVKVDIATPGALSDKLKSRIEKDLRAI